MKKKKLQKLDEFNKNKWESHTVLIDRFNRPCFNGIQCPECGAELYDSNPACILTSNPPQKNVSCRKCGYRGYRLA